MIYITSDLHFNHNKDFVWGSRGFQDIYEMNGEIIRRWNSLVRWNDEIYLLGDVCLGGGSVEAAAANRKLISQLNGIITIIRGNHDTDSRVEMYKECHNVVSCDQYATQFKYTGYHLYLSHYPTLTANYDEDKPLKAKVINLCGHSHTEDKFSDWDKGLIYHCEVDAHDCYPVSLDNILSDIKQKIHS